MIYDPPLLPPLDQLNAIYVVEVILMLLTKLTGALGTNIIMAPLPSCETIDEPTALIAITLANT